MYSTHTPNYIFPTQSENNNTSHAQLRRVVTVIKLVNKRFVGSAAALGSP